MLLKACVLADGNVALTAKDGVWQHPQQVLRACSHVPHRRGGPVLTWHHKLDGICIPHNEAKKLYGCVGRMV